MLYNSDRPWFKFSMFLCLCLCWSTAVIFQIWTCSGFHLCFAFNRIPSALSGPPGVSSSCLSPNGGAPGLLAEFRTQGGTMLSGSLFPVEHPSTAARAVWRPEGGARGFEGVGGGVCSLNLLCESDLWPLISREEQQTWRLWYDRCLMLINRSKTDCAAAVHGIMQC